MILSVACVPLVADDTDTRLPAVPVMLHVVTITVFVIKIAKAFVTVVLSVPIDKGPINVKPPLPTPFAILNPTLPIEAPAVPVIVPVAFELFEVNNSVPYVNAPVLNVAELLGSLIVDEAADIVRFVPDTFQGLRAPNVNVDELSVSARTPDPVDEKFAALME